MHCGARVVRPWEQTVQIASVSVPVAVSVAQQHSRKGMLLSNTHNRRWMAGERTANEQKKKNKKAMKKGNGGRACKGRG